MSTVMTPLDSYPCDRGTRTIRAERISLLSPISRFSGICARHICEFDAIVPTKKDCIKSK